MSGHLGINKTYQRVLEHFYRPNLRKDVVEFCRSCHTCQVVGKPNQTLPKAPFQPIPAFEEPFNRVIIDCVSPLPKTKSGNQYLLTVMCASIRNISAKTIVKASFSHFVPSVLSCSNYIAIFFLSCHFNSMQNWIMFDLHSVRTSLF